MKLICIFDTGIQKLFSIKYSKEKDDEFLRLFKSWDDIQFLENFFDNNKQNLCSGFFPSDFVAHAVLETKENANIFKKQFFEIGNNMSNTKLDDLFDPLSNKTDDNQYALRFKAKDKSSKHSILRIYALKISSNHYVITGGGIKLTRTMQESPELSQELSKFDIVKKFLIKNKYLKIN